MLISDHLSSVCMKLLSRIKPYIKPYKERLELVYKMNILLDLPTYLLISFLIISF